MRWNRGVCELCLNLVACSFPQIPLPCVKLRALQSATLREMRRFLLDQWLPLHLDFGIDLFVVMVQPDVRELPVRFLRGEEAICKLFVYIWVNVFECDHTICMHWQPSSVVIVVETEHPWCYQLQGIHIHVKICRSYGFDKVQQDQLHLQCDRPVFEHGMLHVSTGPLSLSSYNTTYMHHSCVDIGHML